MDIDRQLNVELVAEKLYEYRDSIGPKYLSEPPRSSPQEFVQQLIDAMNQRPCEHPLSHTWSSRDVFLAAVRSLGSSRTDWSKYMKSEKALAQLLSDFDPGAVAAGAIADPPALTTSKIENVLHGADRRVTPGRIFKWAQMLTAEPAWYSSAQTLAAVIKREGRISDNHELMPVFALALSGSLGARHQRKLEELGAPAREGCWKLPGMEFALASEFLRNLGWDGFKPDTHVKRLLLRWLGDTTLDGFQEHAGYLEAVIGTRSAAAINLLCYSLAGVAITPAGEDVSKIDNLVWLIGANVETSRHGTETDYLETRPH